MKRLIVGVGVVVGTLTFGIGTASAATPAVKGCVGTSLSSLARPQSHGTFGHAVVDFAQNSDDPGLGHDIQNLQAGTVTNDIVPNTCNGS